MRAVAALMMAIAAMALCQGCTSRTDHEADTAMEHAETLMQEHPDSALTILQQIPREQITGKRRRALHALLLSQAYDKNWIDLTSDTLIAPAVDYFRSTEENHYKALAYFYAGRVYFNAKNYIAALISLCDAEKEAKRLDDPILKGLISSNISYIYYNLGQIAQELEYTKKAVDYFKTTNKTEYIDYAVIEYSRSLTNNMRYDEALEVIQPILNGDSTTLNKAQLSEAFIIKSLPFIGKHQPDSVVYYLTNALQTDASQLDIMSYRNLIDAYVNLNQLADAERIIKVAQQIYGKDFYIPFSLPQAKQDFKTAFYALHNDVAQVDSVYIRQNKMNLAAALSTYFEEKSLQSMQKAKWQRQQIILTACLFVTLLLSIIMFLINRNKTKSNRIQIFMSEASALKSELSTLNAANLNANKHVRDLLSGKFEHLDRLCSLYYSSVDDTKQRKSISNEVIKEIGEFKNNPKIIVTLEELVNKYCDNLMTNFHADFPKTSSASACLFLYTILGFSSRSISIFLEQDIDNVYKTKNRLKTRIQNSNISKKNLYLSFLSK